MTLNINDPEVDSLAQELAELTGKPVEQAVATALREHVEKQREIQRILKAVREISDRFMALPVLDPRTPDEILGYDEHGLPT
jgi:antitoxin VapB